MFTIGCHLSMKEGLLHMAAEAAKIDANTFQYFTRNPRGGKARAIDEADIEGFREYAPQHGIDLVMAYAPYTVEPASSDLAKRDFTKMVLLEDLARLDEIPGQYYLVRLGSGKGASVDEEMQNCIDTFNEVLSPTHSTTLLIDTAAGEGSQVGWRFEQIAQVIAGIKLADKVGVCLDTSAVWAAGYDIVGDLDGVLDELDQTIGLSKLKAVHLNDSKEKLGSRVDRHARIGTGTIGFDALSALVNNPRIGNCAFYLEEPHATLEEYASDIARFRAARKG